jgi:ureidoacrylate peracid hydrolase
MKLTVEIEVPEPRAVALDSTKTAIVVIDMENEFCAPGGKKFIGSPAQEAVRAAAALIQRGRQHGVPVLWCGRFEKLELLNLRLSNRPRT